MMTEGAISIKKSKFQQSEYDLKYNDQLLGLLSVMLLFWMVNTDRRVLQSRVLSSR